MKNWLKLVVLVLAIYLVIEFLHLGEFVKLVLAIAFGYFIGKGLWDTFEVWVKNHYES